MSPPLSIATVPDDAGTHLGDEFIEAGIAARYYPASIFRLTRYTVNDRRRCTFVSETKPEKTFTLTGDDDIRGLGPMIADAASTRCAENISAVLHGSKTTPLDA